MGRRAALTMAGAVLGFMLAGAASAGAKLPPPGAPTFGSFNSVLAQGEGQTVNAADLAAYESSNQPPNSFISQNPLYAGVMPVAGSLTAATIHRYYKDTD